MNVTAKRYMFMVCFSIMSGKGNAGGLAFEC